MLRILCLSAFLVPAIVQAQQPKLITQCTDISGYTHYFPTALNNEQGWQKDGMSGVSIGLFENPDADDILKFQVMYKTASQGWHTPGPYIGTMLVNETPSIKTVVVLYGDDTTEFYTFWVEQGYMAVSLMRDNPFVTNARLFVGDCKQQ